MAMRIKHFLNLKAENNEYNWVILTRYNLAFVLYQLYKDFRYMISNKFLKTEPKINFF